MKTILIPVDYSENSHQAVIYGLNFAKHLNAKVHICHAYTLPDTSGVAGLTAYIFQDFSAFQMAADQEMANYVAKLSLENPNISITSSTSYEATIPFIKSLIIEKNVDFIIMGTTGASNLVHLIIGSTSRSIIDEVEIPVLLIPKNSNFQSIQKIGFATDLDDDDISSLKQLCALIRPLEAEVLINHIADDDYDLVDYQEEINEFIELIIKKIDYPKINFKEIKNNEVIKGLKWLIKNENIQILSMIHKNDDDKLANIFNKSYTQELIKNSSIPLLVLPELA